MVKNVSLGNDQEHFTAQVQGGIGRYYNVSGRLRPDGRASELKCNCPWAKKGHRCKHQVASLYATEKLQKQQSQQQPLSLNGQRIAFQNLISKNVKQAIAEAQPALDPFKILGKQTFTQKSYDLALQLLDAYSETRCRQVNDKMRAYEYIWNLEKDDGTWLVITVQFTRWQVLTIDFQPKIPIDDQDAATIFALLKFIKEYIKDDPFDVTNQAATELLNFYSGTKNQNETEPIILQAQIDNYGRMPCLSFKLGKGKHLYQVRDLYALVDTIRKQSTVKLGKFFNEPIDSNKMTKDSKKWLNLIERIIDARNLNVYYGNSRNLDAIEIENSIADAVDTLLFNGVKLFSGTHLVGYTSDQLDLRMQITEDNGAANISVEDFPAGTLIIGSRKYYGYYKGIWIRYEGITPTYLQELKLHPGDEFRFSKKTVQQFARQILPRFEKAKYVSVIGAKELRASLPPEAVFIFDLDYRRGNLLCKAKVKYGDKEYDLNRNYSTNNQRETDLEKVTEEVINQYFNDFKDNKYVLSNENTDTVADFLDHGIKKLKQIGEVRITTNFRTLLRGLKSNMEFGISVNLTNELLDLDLTDQKYSWEDIQAALKAYQEKQHYFVLKNGMLQKTDQPTIEQLAQTLHDTGISFKDFIHGKLQIPAYRAFYFAKRMKDANALHFSSNSAFKELIEDLSKDHLKKDKLPVSLESILRPYQKEGFNWLSTIINYNFGGLLADEMGLGKTLQVIALLLARKEQHASNMPSLVVAPASVIYNWQAELKKFAPNLSVCVLDGGKNERQKKLLRPQKYDLYISSYQSLNHDLETYDGLTFDLQVIDEAQNIKNHESITAKSVKVIKAHHKLALTGTPIENKLSELWSIFDYLMPGFLGSYIDFKKNFELPIVKKKDKDKQALLSDMIMPFVLRRLKKKVLSDLPAKDEEQILVKMNKKQESLYQLQTQKLIAQLNGQEETDFKKSRFEVFAQIIKLREICCDPHLLYENYHGKSNKLMTTINLIKTNLENNHKILLFSQFTSMLEILQAKLKKAKIPFFILTGSTPKEKRQQYIRAFNSMDHPGIFLISLKAGGTGINLTSADVVIHYDPWWNLAAENQATDRAHRIGQKNSVKVYKMVTKDTIEERIIKLQQKKAELAQAILGNNNMANASISKADLLKILE